LDSSRNKPVERPLVALVGGETLLAKEVRAVLEESKPAPRVQLIFSAVEGSSLLSADEEEPVVMLPLNAESLEGAKVALLAGSAASSRRAFKIDALGGPVLIDLVGALEDQPQARLRAPSAEPAPVEQNATSLSQTIHVIAHPAAISMALLLSRLAQAGTLRRSVVHVFQPVSEQGQRGLDELHKQTVAVLSFQKLKTDVFDTQVAFGMLARYGEEAEEPLEGVEQRLERHLASLLAGWPGVPMPSLRLIQAPVFHGHSFSVWVEFEQNPGVKAISQILSSEGIDVRPDEPPSNVGIAGQSGLSVGAIAVDANNPRACWLWAVSDNLRMSAENAVAVARELL
jgi:aspartate-semialdehyde dehydrogenase